MDSNASSSSFSPRAPTLEEELRRERRVAFFNNLHAKYPDVKFKDDIFESDSFDERDRKYMERFARQRTKLFERQKTAARVNNPVENGGNFRYYRNAEKQSVALSRPTAGVPQADVDDTVNVGDYGGQAYPADSSVPANPYNKKPRNDPHMSRSHAARTDPIDDQVKSRAWGRPHEPYYWRNWEATVVPRRFERHDPNTVEDRQQRRKLRNSYYQAKKSFIPQDLWHLLSPDQ